MVSLDKKEIGLCLKDYGIIRELMYEYPNMIINDIFNLYMHSSNRIEDYNENYFARMVRVYGIICELRMFSFVEDLTISYLKENELDFDDVKKEIFINKDDYKYFSKKQIVRNIRNAFNHSDENKRLYNISVNGKFVEIDLKNTNPKPFHVKLNFDQLNKINTEISKNSHSMVMSTIDFDEFNLYKPFLKEELEKLKFTNFYISKQINFELIEKIKNFDYSKCETALDIINTTKSMLNETGLEYYIRSSPLMKEQIKKAQESFLNLSKINITKWNDKKLLKAIYASVLDDVIPLGIYHMEQLEFEQMLTAWFMSDLDMTYNKMMKKMSDILNNIEFHPDDNLEEWQTLYDKNRYETIKDRYEINEYSIPIKKILMLHDNQTRIKFPIVIYLEYIASSLTREGTFDFSNIYSDSGHIRNAFVHGRWFFSNGDNIELYDAPSGNNNDYNFNWHKSINLRKLLSDMDLLNKNNKHHKR